MQVVLLYQGFCSYFIIIYTKKYSTDEKTRLLYGDPQNNGNTKFQPSSYLYHGLRLTCMMTDRLRPES